MIGTEQVLKSSVDYFNGDVRRINHFIKVFGFAKAIGVLEQIDAVTQEILEVTAIVHDIGIKVSEEKYSSSAGNYQQIEGPAVAKVLLSSLGYPCGFIERVCFLIAHHHTYNDIQGQDYQILVEADFLVNIYEDSMNRESVEQIKRKIFKTRAGTEFLNSLYLNKDASASVQKAKE
jgi:HD domain.